MIIHKYKVHSKNYYILEKYINNLGYSRYGNSEFEIDKYISEYTYFVVCLWDDFDFTVDEFTKNEILNLSDLPTINFDRIIKIKKLL